VRSLDGVVVLDLGQIYNGPYCSLLLAHLGADVIKVEPISGENTRGRVRGKESYAYVMLGSNKKTISINLKTPRGHQLFLELVKQADLVVENFANGTMERLGLSYDQLSKENPRIILASARGYDTRGPLRDYPAMDLTVQAMTAVMAVTGYPDSPPVKAGVALSDLMGGATLALGAIAALYQRESSGRGQHVEVAMQDAILPTLASNIAGYYESGGTLPERIGNRHGGLAVGPYNTYRCRDGWIAVLCSGDRQWASLTNVIGRPELKDARNYRTPSERAGVIQEIDRIVEEWTLTQSRDEAVARLVEAKVPCAPVRSLAELLEDDFLEKGMLPSIDHPTLGKVRVFGNPVRLSDADERPISPAPPLGHDTNEILRHRLGLDQQTLDALREEEIIY
jgi:crotonobetainyl-CoA:carnitine CoA-transferase CaiB-like acyl-CoA transferase